MNNIKNVQYSKHGKQWQLLLKIGQVNKGNNKLPNSKQSYKGKVKTHNYINRQNQ